MTAELNNKPFTHSTIVAVIGHKGAGKSLYLAYLLLRKMVEGITVWSNMKVKTSPLILARKYSPKGKYFKYCESLPLDWNLLYSLDDSLVEGVVGIDEAGYFAGARQSQDNRTRLINACLRQARHRNLDFYFTARGFMRLDSYLRDEADILIACEDLSYSPWGQFVNIRPGSVTNLKFFDLSGQETGYPVLDYLYGISNFQDKKIAKYAYKEENWDGVPYWNCYNSKEIISLEEAFTGVDIRMRRRRISNYDQEEETNKQREVVMDNIRAFVDAGNEKIATFAFWKKVKSDGIKGDNAQLARLLPEGVRRINRNGYFYDFSGISI
jgi:hypothetical protein